MRAGPGADRWWSAAAPKRLHDLKGQPRLFCKRDSKLPGPQIHEQYETNRIRVLSVTTGGGDWRASTGNPGGGKTTNNEISKWGVKSEEILCASLTSTRPKTVPL